jgi:hypothetical protein
MARLAVVLSVFTATIQGISVGDVFTVKGGATKGGCDGKNIDGWFADSLTLASSASTGASATDEDSRKYLKTFFSIGPDDDAAQAGGAYRPSASLESFIC